MCEELEHELEEGEKAAKALAEHLENMGANSFSRTVETDEGCYIVEVRKTL